MSGKEKTIVFGCESREIVLENMSTTSLGDIQIVTIGADNQESNPVPVTLPKPPEKAEILKAVHGEGVDIEFLAGCYKHFYLKFKCYNLHLHDCFLPCD